MKPIMILGTSSHAGKTTLVAGLCRLFAKDGIKVAPFKSQNMSLNSYATIYGEEISRSIAVQSFAAGQTPSIHMNPILLKPINNFESQLIFHGKVVDNVSAINYFNSLDWHKKKKEVIDGSIKYLKENYNLIIAEGAGSCAEPNFISNDLVNMGIAELLDADVYLTVDIDKGGVFADILGTYKIFELLAPQYIQRIKGIFINKFRGDKKILEPACDFIVRETKIPIVGIIPYIPNFHLEEEDRVKSISCQNPEIDIAILYLPHISNANDFNPLFLEENVRVRFVNSPSTLGAPDLIILPGSKCTLWDLNYMKKIGWIEKLQSLNETPIIGICGGFEMMGKSLHDPTGIESAIEEEKGLGYFDFTVHFQNEKRVRQKHYQPTEENPFKSSGSIFGYEIHCGEIKFGKSIKPLYSSEEGFEGAFQENPLIFGTFIHDIFKNPRFTREVINFLRKKKNLPLLISPLIDPEEDFENQCNLLANVLKENIFDINSFCCK